MDHPSGKSDLAPRAVQLVNSCSWRLNRKSNTNDGLSLADGVYSLSLEAGRSTFGASLTQTALNAIGAARYVFMA